MTWSGVRVLVTGAGGFIGSHLAERLVRLGATTRALTHYHSSGSRGWLDHLEIGADVEVIAGDVRDPDLMTAAAKDMEVVFHLAALIGIPYSYHAPLSYVRTNIEGTLNVCRGAVQAGVRCLVHTSTSEVYGTAQRIPIDEDHPVRGQSPYSASKIGGDKIAESYHSAFGLPLVTIRPFNTYGPRQSQRAIVPVIVNQCLEGPRLKLGNVDPTRDLTFVSDTVDGFLAAASVPAAIGRTINLGYGKEISIRDLALLVGRLTGRDVVLETDDRRRRPEGSEVERLLSDNRLAKELLDWHPAVTLEDGLQRTIEWIRENPGRSRGYVV